MADAMKWRPISELTEAHMDLMLTHRVVLWERCSGAAIPGAYSEIGTFDYFTVNDVIDAGWQKFLVIPSAVVASQS